MNYKFGRLVGIGIALAVLLAETGAFAAQANSHSSHAKLTSIQLLETARSLFDQGDFENARKLYLGALDAYPRDFDLLKNLAYCYYVTGPSGRTQALHFYLLAHKVDPDSSEVAEQLARCLMDLDRIAEAVVILRKLADQPNAAPESWKSLAEACSRGQRFPEASASYETYLRDRPTDLEARAKLGILYGRQTAYTKALKEFQTVLSQDPDFQLALIGKARILSWQGRFDESLRLYSRALTADSANGDAASGKAFALLWAGRDQEAEELFKQLHQRYPANKELAKGLEDAQSARQAKLSGAGQKEPPHDEAYFRDRLNHDPLDAAALKALTAFASTPQRCAESIEFGRQAFKQSPDDQVLELSLANSLAFCRQYNEAVLHYRHYLKAQPKAEGVYFELAQSLLRSRQTAESIQVLQDLLQLDPANSDARLSLAQAHVVLGQYAEAAARYDEVLAASPENYDALQGKAFILYWTKQFAPARKIFQNLSARRPADTQDSEALNGIARAEEEARWEALRPLPGSSAEEFARYYQKRLASHPEDADALRGLAEAQAHMQNFPAAIQSYQQLAHMFPKDTDTRLELARLWRLNRQPDEAISLYQGIVKDNPSDVKALTNLAGAYLESNRPKEAAAVYRELSSGYPSNLEYKLKEARLDLAVKNYPAAHEVLTSVLSSDPRNHDARICLAQLELSEGTWEASLKHFTQLLKEDSEDPDALMGKARISFYRGDLQAAQSNAEAAVKQRPADLDALFLLANIEHARGNRRRTLALLDQAAQVAPTDPQIVEMKNRVSEESNVTVTTTAVYAREIGPPTPCTSPQGCNQLDLHEDLRTYAYGTTIKMHILHNTESLLSVTSLPSDSPMGRNSGGFPVSTGISGAVAPEMFLYRQSTQLSSRFTLRVGAGWTRFGRGSLVNLPGQAKPIVSAKSSPLAQGGISFAPSKKLRVDLDLNRSAIYYTPTAVRLGVMETRAAGSLNIFLTPRTELNADYFYAAYSSGQYIHATDVHGQIVPHSKSDRDQGHGITVNVDRNVIQSARISIDAGCAGKFLGFTGGSRQTYMGFFNPGFYQSQMMTARFRVGPMGPLTFDFAGGAGIQQIEHGGALTRALNLSPGITIRMNRRFSLSMGYTHYNSAQSLGYLSGNAVRLSTEWK